MDVSSPGLLSLRVTLEKGRQLSDQSLKTAGTLDVYCQLLILIIIINISHTSKTC